MSVKSSAGRAHLNLVESSRQLFALDPGAEILSDADRLLAAGSSTHPMISNAAFRADDDLDAEALVAEARSFFGERGRGFSLWVREGEAEDADLAAAAKSAGLRAAYSMPEMVLGRRPEEPALPAGAVLRRLENVEEAEDYWRIAESSYASLGFPAETFASYTASEGLLADNVVAFIAHLDGRPAAIAMTIVTGGVAGIYWVGSLEQARGRGLGRAVTAAATNAGFDLGADLASLQASPMGAPIYLAMGYETIFDYQLLLSPPA